MYIYQINVSNKYVYVSYNKYTYLLLTLISICTFTDA